MITVVQRVHSASVTVDEQIVGRIDRGLLLFVGVESGDGPEDAHATARKALALRVFPGSKPTDRSVLDVGGEVLVVSQFTLAAELRHGNRPDFTAAADPDLAQRLYSAVADAIAANGVRVATGRFAASMCVESRNDGPFTLVLTVRNGRVVARRDAEDDAKA